jgi:hypothetical protein
VGSERSLREFEERLDALPAERRRDLRIDLAREVTDAELRAYPIFGVYLLRVPRVYLAIRCGPRGQNGLGGHDHNDQLSIELQVDGEDWILDPGTYLYTPLPEARKRYRSVRAHFAPQLAGPEPASLDQGPFILGPGNEAACLYWGEGGFAGVNRSADGRLALCRAWLDRGSVRVTHGVEGGELMPVEGDPTDWHTFVPRIPHSPGYGIVERRR